VFAADDEDATGKFAEEASTEGTEKDAYNTRSFRYAVFRSRSSMSDLKKK
jgi:hypothetical protein